MVWCWCYVNRLDGKMLYVTLFRNYHKIEWFFLPILIYLNIATHHLANWAPPSKIITILKYLWEPIGDRTTLQNRNSFVGRLSSALGSKNNGTKMIPLTVFYKEKAVRLDTAHTHDTTQDHASSCLLNFMTRAGLGSNLAVNVVSFWEPAV